MDFTYVDNVVHGHILAAENMHKDSPVCGKVSHFERGYHSASLIEPVLWFAYSTKKDVENTKIMKDPGITLTVSLAGIQHHKRCSTTVLGLCLTNTDGIGLPHSKVQTTVLSHLLPGLYIAHTVPHSEAVGHHTADIHAHESSSCW